MKLIGFLLVAVALAGTVVHMAPASDVDGPHLNDLPGISSDMAIKSLWGPPDDGAVDSGGVEADLDGNASALIASN